MGDIHYARPREKLAQRGVRALSDSELLQVVIGNGVSGARVAGISRKLLKILKNSASELRYDRLQLLRGIGPARAAQLVAAFELSARYRRKVSKKMYDATFKAEIFQLLRRYVSIVAAYVLLDAGKFVISYRIIYDTSSEARRQLLLDLSDSEVAYVALFTGSAQKVQYPDQEDLYTSRLIHQCVRFSEMRVYEEWFVGTGFERKVTVYG